jgi:hypothetical protein
MFEVGRAIVFVLALGVLLFAGIAAVERWFKVPKQGAAWLPMSSAPRDGTVIELRCTYGVAPWYGLHRWTREQGSISPDGGIGVFMADTSRWVAVPDSSHSLDDEQHLSWRPYAGKIEDYRDPTNGRQNTSRYWREGVAKKYGLPLDYFEKPGMPE